MLNENIKNLRKAKGLSQEELAVRLNVVRQTVSKWEQGLSVPDADMLVSLSEAFETPVGTLLGETVAPAPADDLKAIAEKLEVINLQFAGRREAKWKALFWVLLIIAASAAALAVFFAVLQEQYLSWDYSDPETAIAGTVLHAAEFVFARVAPFIFAGSVAGCVIVRKKLSPRR